MSLWRVLLKLTSRRADATLTCDECFLLLDYLADQAANGADADRLLRTARQHLARCPRCREQHLQRLRELEAELARQAEPEDVGGR